MFPERLDGTDRRITWAAPWCSGEHSTLSRCGREFDSRRGYLFYAASMHAGDGWRAVGLDDVEGRPWASTGLGWLPLREALDTRIVGMAAFWCGNYFTAAPSPRDRFRSGSAIFRSRRACFCSSYSRCASASASGS